MDLDNVTHLIDLLREVIAKRLTALLLGIAITRLKARLARKGGDDVGSSDAPSGSPRK